jgi:hypothetical protein
VSKTASAHDRRTVRILVRRSNSSTKTWKISSLGWLKACQDAASATALSRPYQTTTEHDVRFPRNVSNETMYRSRSLSPILFKTSRQGSRGATGFANVVTLRRSHSRLCRSRPTGLGEARLVGDLAVALVTHAEQLGDLEHPDGSVAGRSPQSFPHERMRPAHRVKVVPDCARWGA